MKGTITNTWMGAITSSSENFWVKVVTQGTDGKNHRGRVSLAGTGPVHRNCSLPLGLRCANGSTEYSRDVQTLECDLSGDEQLLLVSRQQKSYC